MLPKQKTKGSMSMNTCSWLIYGQPGIGKSTFAASFDDALFLCTEQSQRHLSIYKVDIAGWKTFIEILPEIIKDRRFKTVVIDTVDLLYQLCLEYVCEARGFDHPADESHGKGWAAVNDEFRRAITKLLHTGKGTVFISHYRQQEVRGRGIVYNKTVPLMGAGCWRIITSEVDIIGYCDFDPESASKRIIRFRPELELEAKDRGGVFPEKPGWLPLNYESIKRAFGTGPGPLMKERRLSAPKKKIRRIRKLS